MIRTLDVVIADAAVTKRAPAMDAHICQAIGLALLITKQDEPVPQHLNAGGTIMENLL